MIRVFLGLIIGGCAGFGTGILIPYLMVKSVVEESGDPTAAGGGMFLMVATVPVMTLMGCAVGSIVGLILNALKNQKKIRAGR